MEVIEIKSFDSLSRNIRIIAGDGEYLYRGQSHARWPLVSSFDRTYNKTLLKREREFNRLIDTYKRQLLLLFPEFRSLDDDRQLMMIAQHNGIPTRLLDWSISPFVAAYFAISGQNTRRAALFALNRTKMEDIVDPSDVEIIDVPRHENKRLVRQQGAFTRMRSEQVDLISYLTDRGDADDVLKKLELSVSFRDEALGMLRLMGINNFGLFGDLPSLAADILTEYAPE